MLDPAQPTGASAAAPADKTNREAGSGAMSAYPSVQRPLTINGCELRNRILRTAHGTALGFPEGVVNDAFIAYHVARARGGVALTILEAAVVHPETFGGGLFGFKPENVDGWRRIGEACRAEGCKVFQQLHHGGSSTGAHPQTGAPAWSPSGGPAPGAVTASLAMTKTMIDDLVGWYVEVGGRCKEAGLDGVELHSAHGYLLHEFLSPLTNRRTDQYGGPLENRMRLAREILTLLRERLGRGFPLGIRLSGSEWAPGGLTSAELIETAQRLEAEGLVDFVNMSSGSYFAPDKIIGAMHEPPGYELPTSTLVTRALKVPTFVNGRFLTLAHCEEVLAAGDADMVSLVRAMVADPHLVTKSLEGREAEVRPCIGCNQECIGGVQGPRGVLNCTVNPEAGRELTSPPLQPAPRRRRVMVVGAGPSGMEAARTAALRGHEVTLHEAQAEVGGNLRFARRAPFRADIGRIIDFQAAELRRLGVALHLNSAVDMEAVRREAPDCVIVATGAEPRRDGRHRLRAVPTPGADLPHVLSMPQALAAAASPETRALVYDDFGSYPPLSVVEHLLAGGARVTLASSLAGPGVLLVPDLTQRPTLERLGAYDGYGFIGSQTLAEITPTHVRLAEAGNGRERIVEANLVVLCVAGEPRRALYDQLLEAGVDARLVGEANAPTQLGNCIRAGHHAALSL
jgi:2,4-dienoyl-CoA reductase-like NADH-dependent reductase (Old Yellow Enzyme family)